MELVNCQTLFSKIFKHPLNPQLDHFLFGPAEFVEQDFNLVFNCDLPLWFSTGHNGRIRNRDGDGANGVGVIAPALLLKLKCGVAHDG